MKLPLKTISTGSQDLEVFEMNLQYNERKLLTLSFAAQHDVFTAVDLAISFNISNHHAAQYLLKYHRQGLLYRGKNDDGIYCYSLSLKGRAKLQYLLSIMPRIYENF